MAEMASPATSSWSAPVAMDAAGRIQVPRAGAIAAALLRIGLGLLYLWAFLAQGFGVGYTNSNAPATASATAAPVEVTYGWHFSYDADNGWITSGFEHSPTGGYIDKAHGPTAWLVQNLPTGVDDFGWIFAIAGLGIALTFGVFSRLAGWGGLLLNLIIWFAGFPPTGNPIIDGEHMAFAFSIFLLMWLQASNSWGLGRWWRAHTPALLN
jgi:thiosulfate dehydrogenase [quinone] large subunit